MQKGEQIFDHKFFKKSNLFKIAWNGKKIGRKWFLDFLAPPQKNLVGVQIIFLQKWKKSKLFKIAWNGEKIGRKWFLNFLAPPKKHLGGVQIFLSKMKKKKSCSKLPEMVRKLVGNKFWTF